jgi:hypothetical protein
MKEEGGKLVPINLEGLEFENDFGESPIGLGHFSKDQGFIAVASLVGAFVGAAIAGIPLAAIVIVAGLNDINYARRKFGDKEQPVSETEEPAIDVESREVKDTPQIGSNTRLNAVEVKAEETVVSDSVQAHLTDPLPVPLEPAPTTTPSSTKWIDNFIRQTALIWGNQGSGKSWMARYIAKRKKDEGYRVVVLDPDSNRAEWEGVESYHDFEEIADFLHWYVEELKGRYKAFNASSMTEDAWRAKLWADGKAIALICEEVTTYVDLIEDKELLTQFFRLGLTKSRKQEMPLTFVSHNNNQTALGGIKGLANLIEKMLQLELQTDIDPETLQPVASGKGAVKLDGSNQWVPVTLPKLESKITNFGDVQPEPVERSANIPERSEKPLNVAEPDEVERLNALINRTFSDSEPTEPNTPEPLNLDPFNPEITSQERGSVVTFRRSGRSKEETIFLVWGAKKGGNKAYVAAREKLDRILSESGLD